MGTLALCYADRDAEPRNHWRKHSQTNPVRCCPWWWEFCVYFANIRNFTSSSNNMVWARALKLYRRSISEDKRFECIKTQLKLLLMYKIGSLLDRERQRTCIMFPIDCLASAEEIRWGEQPRRMLAYEQAIDCRICIVLNGSSAHHLPFSMRDHHMGDAWI